MRSTKLTSCEDVRKPFLVKEHEESFNMTDHDSFINRSDIYLTSSESSATQSPKICSPESRDITYRANHYAGKRSPFETDSMPTEKELLDCWSAEPLEKELPNLPQDFNKLLCNPLLEIPEREQTEFSTITKLFSEICTIVPHIEKLHTDHEKSLRYLMKKSKRWNNNFCQGPFRDKGLKRLRF